MPLWYDDCDAGSEEETPEERERQRYERAIDRRSDCDAHRRSQAESDQICREQGHVEGFGGRCICCDKQIWKRR